MNKLRFRLSLLAGFLLIASSAFALVYTAGSPAAIAKGQVVTVWSADTPTPGTGAAAASLQVALPVAVGASGTPFAIDGQFSGAPGAFEVDVQVAAVDVTGNYQTISGGAITTVDATNQTFHLDATQVTAKFVRLLLRTRTNSVTCTATVTGG